MRDHRVVCTNFPKFHKKSSEEFLSYARKYVNNCGIEKRGTFLTGEGAHKLDR